METLSIYIGEQRKAFYKTVETKWNSIKHFTTFKALTQP